MNPVLALIIINQISTITFLFASLTFLPLALKESVNWNLSSLNVNGWVGIIYGIVFSSAIAYFCYYYGISKIKRTQEVGIFSYIDPIIAVLIAIPLLGEYPNFYYFLGSIMIFGGIYYAEGRIHWHPLHKLKVKSKE